MSVLGEPPLPDPVAVLLRVVAVAPVPGEGFDLTVGATAQNGRTKNRRNSRTNMNDRFLKIEKRREPMEILKKAVFEKTARKLPERFLVPARF